MWFEIINKQIELRKKKPKFFKSLSENRLEKLQSLSFILMPSTMKCETEG